MNLSQPIFQVDQLRVERGTLILDQVSWRVERGQHLVIFGAKGFLRLPAPDNVGSLPNCICPAFQTRLPDWMHSMRA